jgi:phospholipid/cholesterol/gamma-HCH transport system ATP-binding protein
MIEVKQISKSFGDNNVLDNVSTFFEEGKINLIIGQSGSGKTVLLKAIVGLHTIDEGEIHYDNLIFNKISLKEQKTIRKKMGMVFQGNALFDFLTVEENVTFPLNMFSDASQEEKKERANLCLKRVNLHNVNHLLPGELSGGMQKRVAIARAISLNPKYLFCDEPTSGLDPKTAIVIDSLIKELTVEYNTTTIINTHDMNSVMDKGEKIIFIHEGKISWEGHREEIFSSENNDFNQFVFATELAKNMKQLKKTQ